MAYKIRIFGRVQGVGFRWNTKRKAMILGINGWVRNLPDGSVEVLADGKHPYIDEFIEFLKKGPELAEVKEVRIEEVDEEVSPGFEITY